MSERPGPVGRIDLLFEAARIAHEASFELHRRLVILGSDDNYTRRLLEESARIALEELPAVTAQARQLAARWHEQSVRDPEAAPETLHELHAELQRLTPDLNRVRSRQREVARQLRSRVENASER